MVNLFERLKEGRPHELAVEAIKQPPEATPIEKLLDWLVNYWTKPTISAREVCRLGPNSIRDWKSAIDLAEILARHGWLVSVATHQHNMKKWRIVREPSRLLIARPHRAQATTEQMP